MLSLPFQMEFPPVGNKGTCGTRRQLFPAFVLFATKEARKLTYLTSRVQDMSCCMPLPASCFLAEGSPDPVDTKGTTKATLPS